MTPEEEAYEKALRRIREAEDAGALELDLRGAKEGETGAWEVTEFEPLNRLPPELERLTSQSLILYALRLDGQNWKALRPENPLVKEVSPGASGLAGLATSRAGSRP